MTRRRRRGRGMPPSVTVTLFLQLLLLTLTNCLPSIDVHPPPSGRGASRAAPRSSRRAFPALPPWSRRVLAGGTARAAAQALLYPVDALRTLAQTRDGRTLADVGAATLVRGGLSTSAFALFTGAIQFGVFGAARARGCGPLVAGACGAAGSCLVSVPQEVIKQRLVTGVYSSFREAVGRIWATEGIRGFYSAWRPTMSRNVPFVCVTFAAGDALRGRMREHRILRAKEEGAETVRAPALAEDVGVGVSAALVACLLTQPIDVVKTRMMTQAASAAAPYASAPECAATIWRTEGWRRLYSGFRPRCVYMCGLWGITFGLEPLVTRCLEGRSGR